jgi:hypothetical protein
MDNFRRQLYTSKIMKLVDLCLYFYFFDKEADPPQTRPRPAP